MYRLYQKRRSWLWLIISLAIAICAAAILGFFIFGNNKNSYQASPDKEDVVKAEPILPISIDSKMLFVGDVFWGRYINDWSQASAKKEAYPFSRLDEFDRSSYDAWIGNLECPSIIEKTPLKSAQENALLSFNCNPDYLPEAKKWFTAFSLANNHTDNRGGRAGLEETRTNLDKQNIQYFGDYNPENYDDVCEVIAMPIKVSMSNSSTKSGKLPIAMCGYHGVFKIPSAQSLAVMKKYAELMPVFSMPHAGVEYKSAPDQLKTNLYRAMIDNGADAVFGGHPHWVQSAEVYKNRLIAYSIGNFIFDQQFNSEVTRSASIELDLSLSENSSPDLEKWLALGDQCAKFHDDCLNQAKSQNLSKLPLQFKYKLIPGDSSSKITRPASKQLDNAIKQRLGWPEIVKELKPPYSAIP